MNIFGNSDHPEMLITSNSELPEDSEDLDCGRSTMNIFLL